MWYRIYKYSFQRTLANIKEIKTIRKLLKPSMQSYSAACGIIMGYNEYDIFLVPEHLSRIRLPVPDNFVNHVM